MPAYLVELEDGKKYRVESDTPPTEQDIAEYLGGAAPVAKDEPLFDLSDTLSAAGQAVKGLPTTAPHAFRQLYEGLDNPWKRGEGYLKSQEAVDAYQQELEAANLEAEKSGDISTLSRGMRQAGQSLGFSAGAMGAGLVTSTPSAAAGRAIGGLAGPKGAAAGEIIGRGAGALAAGYGAAYRMAGAQFLDDARKEIDAKFLSTVGRPPNEQEQEEAYQELLPLAQAFGNAEAGPEAIGNLAMAGAGKYVFGLGRKTIEKLASSALGKTGAAAGALATELGARVVPVTERGYGAALIGGCRAAAGRYIVMGDCDGSYNFVEGVAMVAALEWGHDLCMGNRFKGGIAPGAMPWKNRHIGNPGLTGVLNLFFRSGIGDAHCGLRAIRKEAFERLGLSGTGMEFASEMVIKAALLKLRIAEVPATLSPDLRERAPHLRPWRDGWRHLRYLFMLSPTWVFGVPGIAALGLSALIFAVALLHLAGVLPGEEIGRAHV
jgi:hypothetical protein